MSLLTFRKNIQIKIDDRVAHRSSETYEERQRFGDFSVLKLGLKLKIRNPIAEKIVEKLNCWIWIRIKLDLGLKNDFQREIENWKYGAFINQFIDQLWRIHRSIQREIKNFHRRDQLRIDHNSAVKLLRNREFLFTLQSF